MLSICKVGCEYAVYLMQLEGGEYATIWPNPILTAHTRKRRWWYLAHLVEYKHKMGQ